MKKEILTEIQINASPEKVWAVLSDNAQWEAWNPLIIKSLGRFAAGEKIANTMVIEGQKPMTIGPKVLVAEPAKELRWLGRLLMPGIFDGEHYFKLEAKDGGTRLVHGEHFNGILLFVMDFDKVLKGFVALNEALKKRVEA